MHTFQKCPRSRKPLPGKVNVLKSVANNRGTMCSPSGIPKIASWLNFCFSSTMGSKKRPHGFMCVELPCPCSPPLLSALCMSQAGLCAVSQTGRPLVLLFLPEKEKRSALAQVSLPRLPLWPPGILADFWVSCFHMDELYPTA